MSMSILDLKIIHRPRSLGLPSLEVQLRELRGSPICASVWSTCLREILFVSWADFESLQAAAVIRREDEVYVDDQAFSFLLEIICGLRSPLVGETEVQGQFRNFLQTLQDESHFLWGLGSVFFQQVLGEAKNIRSKYLMCLGSQSYGSLVRKNLRENQSLVVIGSGHLVEDLLPWLKSHSVTLWARNQQRSLKLAKAFANVQIGSPGDSQGSQVWILAARLSDDEVRQRVAQHSPSGLIDLRGEGGALEDLKIPYLSFRSLMARLENDKGLAQAQVQRAKSAIEKCRKAYLSRQQFRPGGWEDLCG